MSILGILFLGEERAMSHRVAMATWECEHPPGQNIPVADVKFPNQDPLVKQHPRTPRKYEGLQRFNNDGNPRIRAKVTKPLQSL
jgi:hypothetical protein